MTRKASAILEKVALSSGLLERAAHKTNPLRTANSAVKFGFGSAADREVARKNSVFVKGYQEALKREGKW